MPPFPGKRQDSFFGEQIVEFKLTELDVQPRAAKQVVEPPHNGSKWKKRLDPKMAQEEMFFRACHRCGVETAQVKAGTSDALQPACPVGVAIPDE